jgi:predicted ATP-grasp superfamily ATP-dependent carboligase
VVGVYTTEGPGCHSRYCRALSFPKIAIDEAAYTRQFLDLCRSFNVPPVLFPTSDETVSFVSRHRHELSDCALFPDPDETLLENILNKDGTFAIASQCGVAVPGTFMPQTLEEVEKIATTIRFPVIFKPIDTFSVHLPNREKNLTFARKDELLDFFRTHPVFAEGKGVLQEIIWGGDGYIYICAGYFNKTGDALALYTGRKIRQHLPDYGVTCFGESVITPEVERITVDFMKKLGYQGLAAVEYTKDRQTGKFYFLEINARSYYHNSLFLSCGVNLPYVAYLDLVNRGELAIPRPNQKEGVLWIDFARDLGSFWRKFKKRELGLGEWLGSVVRARSFGVFAVDDWGPFFYNSGHLLKVMAGKLVGK